MRRMSILTLLVTVLLEAGAAVEYGLLENLGLGAGWTYVEGNFVQLQCLEACAKGYLFARPLDVFAAAALPCAVSPGFDVVATLWKVFAGIQAVALFQFPGVGWMAGV